MKGCPECHRQLPLDAFSKNCNNKRDGLQYACKECQKERKRQYRLDHPEIDQRYRTIHREEFREYKRNWHIQNKEKVCARARAWSAANPERKKENGKNHYENNKDAYKQRAYARRALLDLGEPIAADDVLARYGGRCHLCYKHVGLDFHIDHIIPLSKGGKHKFTNVATACARCNRRKHNDETVYSGQYFEGWS